MNNNTYKIIVTIHDILHNGLFTELLWKSTLITLLQPTLINIQD